MTRYIGMDVHSSNTTCVVLSPTGRKTAEVILDTQAQPLRDFVRGVRRPRVVVMEEGNQSDWLYEVLSPHADEVLVVQPTQRSRGRKNDSIDAEKRARGARLNEPGRLIYKAPRLIPELRQAAKLYRTTQKDLIRSRARLKMLVQSRGLRPKSVELLDPDDRAAWIERLPPYVRPRAELLGLQIDAMVEVHHEAETWMVKQARQVRAVRWVKSVPGIGKIRAPQIVAAMVTPHRFRTKRQLWRYAGLGVDTRSTNDWHRRAERFERRRGHELVLGLNRDRNPVLKEAFVGAAEQIIRMPANPLHSGYRERIERGMKSSNARLTLARKIAAITLAVWKKEQIYDPKMS